MRAAASLPVLLLASFLAPLVLTSGSSPGVSAVQEDTDVLCLQDGRIIEGVEMETVEEGVKLLYENGEVLVPDELVLDVIIAGTDTSFVPKTDEEKEKFEKGLVPWEGRWIAIRKRNSLVQKRLSERRAQIADIQGHSLWRDRRKERTKHFEFEYTVPQHIFEDFRDLMETYFKEFGKLWRIKQPKGMGRLPISFYGDRETFEQVGGAGSGVLGYFRFVEPLDLNIFYDRQDYELTKAVMYHEVNHYLQKLIDPDFKMPHFPGEAIAEYFAAADWDPEKKKLTIGLIQEGRLTQIKTEMAAGEMLGLRKMLLTDRMYEHYSWGWSFVHFLMNDPRYAKKFQKYVVGLSGDKKVKRTRGAFGLKTVTPEERYRALKMYLGLKEEIDVDRLEVEWHEYLEENLKLVTATGYEKAAIAAMSGYPSRPIRARRLFKEAMEAGSTNPRAYHKYAQLLRSDGRTSEAIELWKKAIKLDPLNAQFYASLGRALIGTGKKEDGERLVALAKEIDPEDPSLEFDVKFVDETDD